MDGARDEGVPRLREEGHLMYDHPPLLYHPQKKTRDDQRRKGEIRRGMHALTEDE